MSHQCLLIVVVMNPIAAIDSDYSSRGTPVILLLQTHQSGADYSRLYSKLRLLLYRVRELDVKYKTAKKIDHQNLKVTTPKGEQLHFSFHLESGLGSNNCHCYFPIKLHFSTPMKIMLFTVWIWFIQLCSSTGLKLPTTRDSASNFQHSITASKLFQFPPLDVWRIRTELFILISILTKMYENDRIQICCDVPNSAGMSLWLPDVLNYSFLWAIIEWGISLNTFRTQMTWTPTNTLPTLSKNMPWSSASVLS